MAQRRRKEQLAKQKQRRSILLCIGGGIGAMLLSHCFRYSLGERTRFRARLHANSL